MELFHRLYFVCLAGMGASLLLTVFLYVKLDVSTAWRVLCGRKDGRREPRKRSRTPPGRRELRKHSRTPSGRREPQKRLRLSPGRRFGKDTEEARRTVLLPRKETGFHVEREVMLIHTDERIEEEEKTSVTKGRKR